MDGRLEVRREGLDRVPVEMVSPDPTSVWPHLTAIREVWLGADDRTLVVEGLRGFETVLHSVDLDESADEVGLLVRLGVLRSVARHWIESCQQHGVAAVGLRWRTEVGLERTLGDRAVIDRGASLPYLQGESVRDKALAQLEAELAAARTPAQRRRLRATIKAIRRNPYKALTLDDATG
jgi:hypothetical protein